ncbi:MAG: PEP-CTERM sorting domain-containing protein [Gammaproteobacteria bacterium]|nr:PEP-CTERM sorting domain-containing protein [Gammaproteobacteria bacterium]
MFNLVKFIAVMLPAFFTAGAFAIPSSTLTGNGVIWTLNVNSINANVASFTLSADVSGSTLGNANLHEFSLKNFGSSASISNLIAPAGTWDWQNEGLSSNGCKDNGTSDALCVYNTDDFLDAPSTASDFQFTFDVSLDVGDLFPELIHFKVRWVEGDDHSHHGRHRGHDNDYKPYAKVGSLISDDFNIAYVTSTDEVPEPAIPGLFAIGLAGMIALRWRRI